MKSRFRNYLFSMFAIIAGYDIENSYAFFLVSNIFICFFTLSSTPILLATYKAKDRILVGMIAIFKSLVLFYNYNHSLYFLLLLLFFEIIWCLFLLSFFIKNQDAASAFQNQDRSISMLRLFYNYQNAILLKFMVFGVFLYGLIILLIEFII